MKKELLIGCGSNHSKRMTCDDTKIFDDVTTVDFNPDHRPDLVWDLNNTPYPYSDNTFDEIHAYEVLEHLGSQGDYKAFFAQFSEFWRLLKPNGHFLATCPSRTSVWAYGDPSHTRILQKEQLVFLNQEQYALQVGKTSMSDFRNIYKADFEAKLIHEDDQDFNFIIQAIKPSRIKL
jgi:predicted SAM-dependent methyltransferase